MRLCGDPFVVPVAFNRYYNPIEPTRSRYRWSSAKRKELLIVAGTPYMAERTDIIIARGEAIPVRSHSGQICTLRIFGPPQCVYQSVTEIPRLE
jgi:hypothetical protein